METPTMNPHAIHVNVNRPATGETRPAEGPNANDGRPEPVDRAEPKLFYTPPIDIHEGPNGLVLEADIPGATEQTVTVALEDNVLVIRATVPPPQLDGARPIHEESRVAEYQRSFILSDEVARDRISAELHDGILRLHLPRAERAKTRRIEVKSPTS